MNKLQGRLFLLIVIAPYPSLIRDLISLSGMNKTIHLYILSVYLFFSESVHLSIHPSICQYIRPSIYLSIYISICLSVYLSICLSIHLSIYLSAIYIYASVYLSFI